ncbi:MAG: 1-deoxy-D-xylulose-5-phosphate reductoisomerase [Defluviitaleaceae bacterium]|nr:1-deoxy-D-xylulose-5-phosphate reductoisomerase [Defluviitaleaceae bacterium]
MKKISILGSTGSIGRQSLEVLENLSNTHQVVALTAFSNIDLLEEQVRKFRPNLAVLWDENDALELEKRVCNICKVDFGINGMKYAAALSEVDLVLNSVVGNAGLLPTIAALEVGKPIAIANKEVLVTAGEIIMPLARSKNVEILPVDSEHSAIFQCLSGHVQLPDKIYLTASGGPFRGKTKPEMVDIAVEQALSHPNWSMGQKISIDSATMMNKGLEVIEARWLFNLAPKQIHVLVHPQSIVHSMVEFVDGQVLAQLGAPDMRLAIQHAITYPNRLPNPFKRLNFVEHNTLTFNQPDTENFPCLALAYRALEAGGHYPTVLNAANEAAVDAFLNRKIGFLDIPAIIDRALSAYNDENKQLSIESILMAESWAKTFAARHFKGA